MLLPDSTRAATGHRITSQNDILSNEEELININTPDANLGGVRGSIGAISGSGNQIMHQLTN